MATIVRVKRKVDEEPVESFCELALIFLEGDAIPTVLFLLQRD
jgi:hypothetical protein